MRNLLILSSLLISFAASANSVKVTSDSSTLPAKTIQILLEQGAKFSKSANNTQTITVKNIHCDSRSNGALDGVLGGIPTSSCKLEGGKVAKVANSIALLDTIIEIEKASEEVYFTDCIMGGRCVTDVKEITCTVDLNIEAYSNGRFSCVYTAVE